MTPIQSAEAQISGAMSQLRVAYAADDRVDEANDLLDEALSLVRQVRTEEHAVSLATMAPMMEVITEMTDRKLLAALEVTE